MEKLKRIFLRLLFPHSALIILLVPISAAMLIYTFAFGSSEGVFAYISYFLSAYTVTVLCAKSPAIIRRLKRFKAENKYINIYTADPHLRLKLSLSCSAAANILYALLQLWSGIVNRSVWFYSLAGYYILLVMIRVFLLRETIETVPAKNRLKEFYRYRLCGGALFVMNIALAVVTFFIVRENKGFTYHYIHTIALAAYTFSAMSAAIVSAVRYRKYESPVMSASKMVSLISALVSMLSLETAMLSAFSEAGQENFRRLMTALTGAAVCVLTLAMAIYMIIHSNREIKKLKSERSL